MNIILSKTGATTLYNSWRHTLDGCYPLLHEHCCVKEIHIQLVCRSRRPSLQKDIVNLPVACVGIHIVGALETGKRQHRGFHRIYHSVSPRCTFRLQVIRRSVCLGPLRCFLFSRVARQPKVGKKTLEDVTKTQKIQTSVTVGCIKVCIWHQSSVWRFTGAEKE